MSNRTTRCHHCGEAIPLRRAVTYSYMGGKRRNRFCDDGCLRLWMDAQHLLYRKLLAREERKQQGRKRRQISAKEWAKKQAEDNRQPQPKPWNQEGLN